MSCSIKQVAAVAAVVVMGIITGCGSSGSSSGSSASSEAPEATPLLHQPVKVWTAPDPGGTPQGGSSVSYEALAASGNVMVGVTFGEPEGTLLVRMSPSTGKAMWTAPLPSYPEANAITISEGRILLVAPGEKLTPEGDEGEGPAMVYAFNLKGAKLWQHSLGFSTSGTVQAAWTAPELPDGESSEPELLTDFTQIPGEIILYEGQELRGINASNGKEWSYTPEPAPERITGPDPGGPEDLHLVIGTNEVLIDGRTGVEKGRDRSSPTGQGIGLVGPLFQPKTVGDSTEPNLPGIGPVNPLLAYAGNVVYGAVKNGLIAIDIQTSKELWTLPDEDPFGIETAAAGNGYVLVSDNEGTFLLEEASK